MRCLEFYSGVGGMHYGLNQACPEAEIACTFDINVVANDVYEHNHGQRPHQGNIEKLSAKQLDSYAADMWMLAPPCQPYTRRGLQKDAADWRASSFMKLLQKLPQMQVPPKFLLVENVVGFEQSRTRAGMAELMQGAGYAIQEFLISPVQLGIPYSRPRYFAVMKHAPEDRQTAFPLQTASDGAPFTEPPSSLTQHHTGLAPINIQPLRSFLQYNLAASPACPLQHVRANAKSPKVVLEQSPDLPNGQDHTSLDLSNEAMNKESLDMPNEANEEESLCVPDEVLQKWGHVLDIVTPDSRLTNCFTKTYTCFAKGCGSVLATENLDSICFELSTQQRSSSSQPFIKPRLIARPAVPLLHNTSVSMPLLDDTTNTTPTRHQKAEGAQQLQQCQHAFEPILREPQQCAGPECNGKTEHAEQIHQCQHAPEHAIRDQYQHRVGLECNREAQDAEQMHHAPNEARSLGNADNASQAMPAENTVYSEEEALIEWLKRLKLRYFTPREVANLHSFPSSFSFPPHVSRKQQYALLGNSLSAAVVADLVRYLLD